MANNSNLKPLSTEEARKRGSKGGKASVKARRKKKMLRETFETLLTMPIKDGDIENIEGIKNFAALKDVNISVQEAMAISMLQRAIKGNVKAAEFIRDTIGQTQLELDNKEQKARIKKLEAETARIKGEDLDAEKDDDGFIDALKGEVGSVWDE